MDQSSVVKMGDLGFAFSDVEFSDRVLRIEVTSYDGSSSTTTTVKVLTLNISSCLLASESAFFHKLLENGIMGESDETEVTLEINASEEAALMDLLNFMYINSLSATTIPDLMDVQKVAAKFEVISCMRYCSQNLPTPVDHYELDPPNSSVASVQALKDAAKKYLVERFRDFTTHRSQEEAMALPLSALEVVLSIDGLRVNSEDDVFDFIIKWGIARYPKLEERREVLSKRLARLVHFPYLFSWKLRPQVVPCPHFDPKEMWRLVWSSLQFHVGYPHGQCMLVDDELIKRVYKYRPVKMVVYSRKPVFSCAVYLNLTKEECQKDLFGAREAVFSQRFFMGPRHCFSLLAMCRKDRRTSLDHLDLFLHMHDDSFAKACTLDYELQVMKRHSEGLFESYECEKYTFRRGKQWGKKDLLGIPWTDFMADDSEYFVHGVLHLRAQLTLNHSGPPRRLP